MADDDLKVFISWSGDLSREVTKVIRQWLPKIFDRIDPWMSDIDIQAGTRGLNLIEERLNISQFGIIVVTAANMEKTWLNFEAGALSKKFGDNLSRVVPIMADFESPYQIDGPIRQFQAVKLDKDGMQSLLEAITNVTDSDWDAVKARFEWSWGEFAKALEEAKEKAGDQPDPPELTDRDLLEQILQNMNADFRPQAVPAFNNTPSSPQPMQRFGERLEVMSTILAARGIASGGIRTDGQYAVISQDDLPSGFSAEDIESAKDILLKATGMTFVVSDEVLPKKISALDTSDAD